MSESLSVFGRLLLGTVIYRPYVYGFFVCFLVFALRHLRVRGVLLYLPLAFLIAFVCEYNSTNPPYHLGAFPFGVYTYIDTTRVRELWLANVPFWDSLSFVFLSYFSWIVAAAVLSPRDPRARLMSWKTAVLAGFLMMILDIVIDPLTLQGDKWFLGRIYFYPSGGSYFGVTLSNFLGWWFVGSFTVWVAQRLEIGAFAVGSGREFSGRGGVLTRLQAWGCFGVYAGVLGFNLTMTAIIHDTALLMCSLAVALVTLSVCSYRLIVAS